MVPNRRSVVGGLLIAVFWMALLLAACQPGPLPTLTAAPTNLPASTSTLAPSPTATPYPTETFRPSPTITSSPISPSPTDTRLPSSTPNPTGTATAKPRQSPTPAGTPVAQFPGRNLSLQSPQLNGDDVRLLQERLLALGYTEISVADGWFGPLTDQGVRHFQENNGLQVDGIVGPVTWKRLFSAAALPAAVTRTPIPTRLTRTPAPTPTRFYPRVDGSDSTWPLQVLLAAKRFGDAYEWRDGFDERFIYVDPDSTTGKLDIQHQDTAKAYLRLIQGKTDFILVVREPTADELAAAQAQGVSLEVMPVARDGFVFMNSWKNPVTSLTIGQVRGIYSGQIKNWAEVGGPPGLITPYQRDRNSGIPMLMDKLVMQGLPMVEAPDLYQLDQFGPFNLIRADEGGLGYADYYYAHFIGTHPQVKLIGVDGVMPNAGTIAQRTYPLLCEVYAVVRAGASPGDLAVMLRDWILTPEGQAVVKESGYAPVQ